MGQGSIGLGDIILSGMARLPDAGIGGRSGYVYSVDRLPRLGGGARSGAALALGVGAIFLSFSAYAFLESRLDPAGASAIVGLFWASLGGAYFVANRRRRT